MKRIEVPLELVRSAIGDFYKFDKHHFVVMNGLDLGDKMEVQWFFANYEAPGEVTCFSSNAAYDAVIPTIADIVKSAWVTESEFYDLFDVRVENAKKGFVLEPDSEVAPLRRKK
jgi:NADH:ubiquinone oxidoreductase subunit C